MTLFAVSTTFSIFKVWPKTLICLRKQNRHLLPFFYRAIFLDLLLEILLLQRKL